LIPIGFIERQIMSYDEIFEAAGIVLKGYRPYPEQQLGWSDMRQLVDYFVENWEPRKSDQDDNEKDFEIQRTLILGDYIIRKVRYKQYKNIVVHVFPPLPGEPQFGELHSEVAAFPPSEEGWSMAIQFVSTYIK
jgi:hypothetical protein